MQRNSLKGSDRTVAVIGLGYFSQFHLAAWQKLDGANLLAACDPDTDKRLAASRQYGIETFANVEEMLSAHAPQIIDIVAPPDTHAELLNNVAADGRMIICQKPFCSTLQQAEHQVALVKHRGAQVVIHENFRFQPWHRRLKRMIDDGELGDIYSCQFFLRPGDGRGKDAYLARQAFFQRMPRFLIRETGVHFIDLFRWLFGEVESVYAELSRRNPVIAGEDSGLLLMQHESGVQSIFNGNRLADHVADNTRLTMGEMLLEAERGCVRLDGSGTLTLREFGSSVDTPIELDWPIDLLSFGGGCVEYLIRGALSAFNGATPYENEASDYLQVVRIADAAYQSAESGARVRMTS